MSQLTASKPLGDELSAAGIAFEVLTHARTTTAREEAEALQVPPATVAKTLLIATRTGIARALIPASDRLDLHKVREVLDDPHAALMSEDTLAAAYPEFELGAVPPIGGAHRDRLLVDIGVCEAESVIFEAGTHDESVRVAVGDLVAHESALIADICVD